MVEMVDRRTRKRDPKRNKVEGKRGSRLGEEFHGEKDVPDQSGETRWRSTLVSVWIAE
jgi:hypothetical protein